MRSGRVRTVCSLVFLQHLHSAQWFQRFEKKMTAIVSIYFVALTCSALVSSSPVAENEVKDHGYLGMATKTIPKSVIAINLQLTKNLVKEKPGENVLFSAVGAYSALMMLHLAAGDRTRQELDKVFNITDKDIDHEKLHDTFSAILGKIEHKSSGRDDLLPETAIANGFFVQKGRPILDSFIQSLKKHYKANATNVDFLEHAAEATEAINAWISASTNKRIDKFYTSPLPATTVSVLTNAWYFNGVWHDTFMKEHTKTEKFHTGEAEIEVPMMQNQKVIAYSHSDRLMIESIELPYRGGEHVMIVFLPYANQTLKNFTEHNHLFDIHEYNRNTRHIGVDYKIPKMKVSWKNSLVNALKLDEIFRNADLSRMSGEKVPVSDIFQATDMEVDEQGTIASAATVISNTRILVPPVKVERQFYVDRPFMMTIVHKPSLMIPFQAVVYKPK